jgi:acyl carrier protein
MQNQHKINNYQSILSSLEYVLTEFQQNQSDNLEIHSNYLNHQVEYTRSFFKLMQQKNSLFAHSASSKEMTQLKCKMIESLNKSIQQFHSQQGDTLRVHEQYLQQQVEYTKNFFQLMQKEYSHLIGAEAVELVEKNSAISEKLNPIVNTCPSNSPELQINPVESTSQLSIKTEKKENLVTANSQSWEIQDSSAVNNSTNVAVEAVQTPTSFVAEEAIETLHKKAITDINTAINKDVTESVIADLSNLSESLLVITSEKTGYPVEMLELDMDMEADLGIDSIKRVEIMGALQEMYPELPQPDNVEELGELRTIAQIVDYLQQLATEKKKSLNLHNFLVS